MAVSSLDEIKRLADQGRDEEAIEQLLKLGTIAAEQEASALLVNLLAANGRHAEAIGVFDAYQTETGRPLRCDVSREELERHLGPVEVSEHGAGTEVLVFSRQSFWQRGHFSNLPRLRPVKEIAFSGDEIRFTQGGRTYKYSPEQLRATVSKKKIHKSYGAGTGGRITQRTMTISAPDKTFEFDISSNFPDFARSRALEAELRKRIEVIDLDQEPS